MENKVLPKKKCFESPAAVCPFYNFESRQQISCVWGDTKRIHLTFLLRSEKKQFSKRFCNGGWRDCSVCKVILAEFEKNEKKG